MGTLNRESMEYRQKKFDAGEIKRTLLNHSTHLKKKGSNLQDLTFPTYYNDILIFFLN